MIALNTVRPASRIVVPASSVKIALRIAATSRMICMKSWYCRTKARNPDSFLAAASLFGPWERSRSAASVADNPCSGSTPS